MKEHGFEILFKSYTFKLQNELPIANFLHDNKLVEGFFEITEKLNKFVAKDRMFLIHNRKSFGNYLFILILVKDSNRKEIMHHVAKTVQLKGVLFNADKINLIVIHEDDQDINKII